MSKSLNELKEELKVVKEKKLEAVREQSFEKACSFREKELALLEAIAKKEEKDG